MSEKFSYSILIKVVAQICEMIGFHKTTARPVAVLADILKEYLLNLGRKARQYAEHSGRLDINFNDLSLAFYDFNVSSKDLIEFYQSVGPLPTSVSVPKYPIPKRNHYLLQYFQQTLQQNNTANNDEFCSLEKNKLTKPKDTLKIKISLSKIKEACETKQSKSKKSKKKRKREKENN